MGGGVKKSLNDLRPQGQQGGGYSTWDHRAPRNAQARILEDAQSQLREQAQQQGGGSPMYTGFPLPPQEQQGPPPGTPGGSTGTPYVDFIPSQPILADPAGGGGMRSADFRDSNNDGIDDRDASPWKDAFQNRMSRPAFRKDMQARRDLAYNNMADQWRQKQQDWLGGVLQRPGWRGMPQRDPRIDNPMSGGVRYDPFPQRPPPPQRPPQMHPPGTPGYPQTPQPWPYPQSRQFRPNPNQDWWQPPAPQGPYASGYQGPLARPAGWPDRGVGSNFSSPWAPRQPQQAAGKGGGGYAQPRGQGGGNQSFRSPPYMGVGPGSAAYANGGLVRGYQAGGGVNNAGKGGGGQAPAPTPPPQQNSAGKSGSGTTSPGNYRGGYGQPWGQPNYGGYQGQPWGQPNYGGWNPPQNWGMSSYTPQYRGQTDYTPPAPTTQNGFAPDVSPWMPDTTTPTTPATPAAPTTPAAPAPAAKGWGHSTGPSINEDLAAAQAYINQGATLQNNPNAQGTIQHGQGHAEQQARLARLARMGVAAPTSEIGPGGVTDINQSGQANVTDFILQAQRAQQAQQQAQDALQRSPAPVQPPVQTTPSGGLLPGENVADFIRRGQQPQAPINVADFIRSGQQPQAAPNVADFIRAGQQPQQPVNVADFIRRGQR